MPALENPPLKRPAFIYANDETIERYDRNALQISRNSLAIRDAFQTFS